MSRVLGTTATSGRAALIRMVLTVAVSSAFLNNTPIVALMIPILISWGRRCNVSPKLLLLPLSYASIFGGTTTLIGTSTNLVISGMQARVGLCFVLVLLCPCARALLLVCSAPRPLSTRHHGGHLPACSQRHVRRAFSVGALQRYAGTPDAVFNFFDITPYGLP